MSGNSIPAEFMTPEGAFIPPRLWYEPPEGWVEWAVDMAKKINPNVNLGRMTPTSRDLIEANAPAYMHNLNLPLAMTGGLERRMLSTGWTTDQQRRLAERIAEAETVGEVLALAGEAEVLAADDPSAEPLVIAAHAKAVRLVLDAGIPISIKPFGSPEKYRWLRPHFRKAGDGEYLVGEGKVSQRIEAESPDRAIREALRWYLKAREAEVKRMQKQALEAAKRQAKGKHPYVGLLAALLRSQKVLFHDGVLVAWENRAHGLYGVDGGDWLYLMKTTPDVAARLSIVAHRTRFGQDAEPLGLAELAGRVPEVLGLDGWKESDGGYSWDGGRVDGDGVISVGDRRTARVVPGDGTVTVVGPNRRILSQGPVPRGLTRGDLVAWGVYVAIDFARTASRRR